MKSLKIFSFVSLLTLGSIIIGCKKDTTSSKTDLTLEMLSDKDKQLHKKYFSKEYV